MNPFAKNFPGWLQEDYMADGYFESFAASAFVGYQYYGILIRSDLDFSSAELFWIFLHEISHIYCTVNEIDGGHLIHGIFKLTYINLSKERYWRITPDFIFDLGERYLSLITNKSLKNCLGNKQT